MSENEMTESENVTTMVIDDDDDPVVGVKKNLARGGVWVTGCGGQSILGDKNHC